MTAYIDKKYVQLISTRFPGFKWKSANLANCRCVLCGDSKTSKNKKRGYFYVRGDSWVYFCHNACGQISIKNLLKRLDLKLYQDYQMEQWDNTMNTSLYLPPSKTEVQFDLSAAAEELRHVKTIWQLPSTHIARQYLDKRKIPAEYYSVLRWVPDFMAWTNILKPGKFEEKNMWADEGRILIPFFSKDKKFFAYIGRSLNADVKQGLRYILIVLDHSIPLIFGMDRYDEHKKAYAVEGQFDSLFLPNCLALNGTNLSTLTSVPSNDRIVLVFDNEPHSKEAKGKIKAAIELGYKVCIWPRWVEYKDINQMIEAGWTSQYIQELIDDNTFDGFEAKFKLEEWSLR